MFDIGMLELLVIGIVALIVVGPKDLPKMFRTLGQVTGKIRGMAREFQTTMNAAASETGLDEMAKDLRKATDVTSDLRKMANPARAGVDALKDAAKGLDKFTPAEGDEPRTETEKLAAKRAQDNKDRIAAAHEAAEARRSAAAEEAADEADHMADAAPAETPRTGTSQE